MDFQENLTESIAKLQEEYYNKNKKNTFFKKNQKNECANLVLSNIDKPTLFSRTFFIIPEKNSIYFDYMMFKSYMTVDIYEDFLDYSYELMNNWVNNIEYYEMHFNIQSVSISAFERYRDIIDRIFKRYPPVSDNYVKMNKLYVYYTPSIIENILHVLTPFVQHIRGKLVLYSKTESHSYLEELFKS
jgi:hypothetical protein